MTLTREQTDYSVHNRNVFSPCKIETFASCPTGTESPSWSGSLRRSRQSRAAAEPDLDNYLFVIHFEFEPVLVLV